MSLTEDQLDQLAELHEQGFSIREIAKETGLPKSRVERGLRQLAGTEDTPDPVASSSRTDANSNLPAQPAESPALKQMTSAMLMDIGSRRQAEQQQQARVQQRQDWFVTKVNRLIKELITNARRSWDEDEVDDFINRAEVLKEKLVKFCERQAIDEEGLQIWVVLDELIRFMTEHQEENASFFGSTIEFELNQETIRAWRDNLLESFDEPALEEESDEDDFDEHEDEDDEHDDDEDDSEEHEADEAQVISPRLRRR